LAEAISSFEAPITPSRWAKRDSSCVGVTALDWPLITPCLWVKVDSSCVGVTTGEESRVNSSCVGVTTRERQNAANRNHKLQTTNKGNHKQRNWIAYYAMSLGEARILLRPSDVRGEATPLTETINHKQRKPQTKEKPDFSNNGIKKGF